MPARYSTSGRRERLFFKTRREAQEVGERLREERDTFGDQARAISASLAADAHAASQLLKPFGVGLLEAVQKFVQLETEARNSQEVDAAFHAFLLTKEGRSDRQIKAYELAKGHFVEEFGGRQLATISGPELVEHIENVTGGPTSFNHRSRLIKSFWRWCARQPRAWCQLSAIEFVDPKETSRGEITVLSAAECEALFSQAEQYYPDCVPALALSLYTGMRKAELERLQPRDVTGEGVKVPATSAKIKRRRFVEMTPALKAWLKAYPISDTVLPTNWSRKERAIRRLAGWRVWSDLVEAIDLDPPQEASPPNTLPKWPDNAVRHTHASVAIATGKPLDSLIFEFGHTGSVATLKAYYAGVMPKREAMKILKLRPQYA